MIAGFVIPRYNKLGKRIPPLSRLLVSNAGECLLVLGNEVDIVAVIKPVYAHRLLIVNIVTIVVSILQFRRSIGKYCHDWHLVRVLEYCGFEVVKIVRCAIPAPIRVHRTTEDSYDVHFATVFREAGICRWLACDIDVKGDSPFDNVAFVCGFALCISTVEFVCECIGGA